MKTFISISLLFLAFIISLSLNGQATTITLTCNTDIITQDNFNDHSVCNFGQPATTSNEEFLTRVQRGEQLTWQGISSTDPTNDQIDILWIKKDGSGKNLFNRRRIKGDGQPNEKVRATVTKGEPGDIMKYAIKFKVKRGGSTVGNFVIDPKLQI